MRNTKKSEENEPVKCGKKTNLFKTQFCAYQFFRGGGGGGEGGEGEGRGKGRGYLQPLEFKTTYLSLRTRPTTRTQSLCFASESKTAQREVYRLLYKFGLAAQEHFLCILHSDFS